MLFLRAELKKRDEQIFDLTEKLEKALLHIEELQKYVFRGKKKLGQPNDNKNDKASGGGRSTCPKREASLYRRPVPDESEITDTKMRTIENCPHCQTKLTKLKILEFYEEDIYEFF